MAESHVVSGLVAKRAELAGLIDHHRKEVDRIAEEVKTLDAAIKLFSPDYRVNAIKTKRHRKQNDFFKAGEASRMILDVLRESGKLLTTNGIAKSIMLRKGIDAKHEKALQATILTILHRQKKSGLVEMAGKDINGCCIWSLSQAHVE